MRSDTQQLSLHLGWRCSNSWKEVSTVSRSHPSSGWPSWTRTFFEKGTAKPAAGRGKPRTIPPFFKSWCSIFKVFNSLQSIVRFSNYCRCFRIDFFLTSSVVSYFKLALFLFSNIKFRMSLSRYFDTFVFLCPTNKVVTTVLLAHFHYVSSVRIAWKRLKKCVRAVCICYVWCGHHLSFKLTPR